MDTTLAYELACLSHLSYRSPNVVSATASLWGYELCEFFDCKGTQAYVMMSKDRTVVAFRGTESNKLEDWVTDFRRWKQPVTTSPTFGRIHSGFEIAFTDIWSPVLASFFVSSRPVYLTGHSLGGALATRAVVEILTNGGSVNGMYTFGQPRVGNRKFAREFDKRFKHAYRFVHNNDIVARLPWLNYWHIGRLVYLTSTGEILEDSSYWNFSYDRFLGRWKRWAADGIRDHNMTEYKNILTKAVQ